MWSLEEWTLLGIAVVLEVLFVTIWLRVEVCEVEGRPNRARRHIAALIFWSILVIVVPVALAATHITSILHIWIVLMTPTTLLLVWSEFAVPSIHFNTLTKCYAIGLLYTILTILVSSTVHFAAASFFSFVITDTATAAGATRFFSLTMIAGFVEESCKYLVTVSMIKLRKGTTTYRETIVFAAAGAMAFATLENVMYTYRAMSGAKDDIASVAAGISISHLRTLLTLAMHVVCSMASGHVISNLRRNNRNIYLSLPKIWKQAMFHATYNGLLGVSAGLLAQGFYWGYAVLNTSAVLMVLIAVLCIVKRIYSGSGLGSTALPPVNLSLPGPTMVHNVEQRRQAQASHSGEVISFHC